MSFIDVTVIRGDGDVFGEEIVDTLIRSEGVAVQRGRNLIDANADARSVSITARYRPGLEIGQIIRVADATAGAAWLGKISDVSLSVEGIDVVADISVERPL